MASTRLAVGQVNPKELRIHTIEELAQNMSVIKSSQYEKFSLYINPYYWEANVSDKHGSFASESSQLEQFNGYVSQIKNITYSVEIDLRDNYLKDDRVQGLCSLISNNPNVQKLVVWVSSNFLTDAGTIKILNAITKVVAVKTLSLNFEWYPFRKIRNFEITNDSIRYLMHTLKKLPNLSQLHVRMSL